MLRVEVCTRALRASQNVKKRCVPCVFALPKRVHEGREPLAMFYLRFSTEVLRVFWFLIERSQTRNSDLEFPFNGAEVDLAFSSNGALVGVLTRWLGHPKSQAARFISKALRGSLAANEENTTGINGHSLGPSKEVPFRAAGWGLSFQLASSVLFQRNCMGHGPLGLAG